MVKNAIEFEFRLVVTLNAGTGMPEVSALPASGLSTLTSSSICAATEARFAHCFATVWLRTPFQVLVGTDFHVHLDHFVFPIDFLRAKTLNLFCSEKFFTLELHARQVLNDA
jgi:hypothetical protein